MKSTFLKAAKTVALSLSLMLAASGAVFANGAGAPPTTKVAMNGGGTSPTWTKRKNKRKRLVRRTRRTRNGSKTA